MRFTLFIVLLGIGLGGPFSQYPFAIKAAWAESPPPTLDFVDEAGKKHALSQADIAKLPRAKTKATGHDKQEAEYEGVKMSDLLQSQGVVLGKELKGARVANYVLFEATDGYRVVLALTEVDPETTDKMVLLADRKNGMPLPEKEGPWRLILPDEKRPVRWIRMVQRISVCVPPPAVAK